MLKHAVLPPVDMELNKCRYKYEDFGWVGPVFCVVNF